MASQMFKCVHLFLMIASIVRIYSIGILDRATSAAKQRPQASPDCWQDVTDMQAACINLHLDSVPNNLHPHIQGLSLQDNNIQKLTNSSFNRYRFLDILDLSCNHISIIEEETFKQLHVLRELDLHDNPSLYMLDFEVFKWSRQLLHLNLENTGLVYIPTDSMAWLQNLEYLNIANNYLTSIHLNPCPNPNASVYLSYNNISWLSPETTLINCDLKELGLDENPVVSVDPNLFSNLRTESLLLGGYTFTAGLWSQTFRGISHSNIRSLTIYPIAISYIPHNFFDPLHIHSPSFLEISGESDFYWSVHGVHPLAFRNLSRLSGLNILQCNITTIEPYYFNGMRRLTYLSVISRIVSINLSKKTWDNCNLYSLDLSCNSLRVINPYTFRGLNNLQELYLGSNHINVLEITSFSGLGNLRYLDLSYTKLKKITMDLPLLTTFSMAESRLDIRCLSPGMTFKFTRSLTKISLAKTGAQISMIYDDVRDVSLFQGLHNLTSLNMRINMLYTLLSGMFRGLFSLKELDLGESRIGYIALGTFKGLKSLRTLKMDRNHIKVLTFDMLRDLTELRSLIVEFNEIYYLEINLFKNNKLLSSLLLANNHLVSFNRSTFEDVWYTLVEIDISGNLIVCECGLKWLLEWLSGPINLKNTEKTICSPVLATLGPLRGNPLMMLASTELCHPLITSYLFAAFSFITVFASILVSYWHRWFLRHKLFLLKLAIIGYKEIEDGRTSDKFEYAVNIVFTDDCEEWIRQHLRPFLEGTFPDVRRVVFGDDDLKIGMRYLDAVLYAMENSFKTVLLLTRAAIDDHLFLTKLRLAMDYATDIGTDNLILVFIEDIQDDELPYPVKLFLSGSGSYLSWVDDEAEQEYFWEQLQKYLNVNRKINHLIPGQ